MSFAFEDQLIVLCSQVKLDPLQVYHATALLNRTLDWQYLLEVSIRHGVSPLFYHGLQQVLSVEALAGLIPAGVLIELQRLYQGNQRRNMRLFSVTAEVFSAFKAAGVEALGLKDIQLAAEIYPSGLRTMGDLDILIRPEQQPQAAAVLETLGFLPMPSDNVPYTHKYAWGQHFRRAQDEVWIDLQHNVMQIEWDCYEEGSFNFEIQRMWRGARNMQINDSSILVPNAEDMLFHLCLHLEGHAYSELILFCDIAELLRRVGKYFDWTYFLTIARNYKVEGSIYYVLLFVQQLFRTQIPAHVLSALQPSYFKANLFAALYGNLTTLHLSLDEIRRASAATPTLLSRFEVVVRQQAASAMQLFKSLDAIVTAFTRQGGDCLLWEGALSERIFPDPTLAPFQEVRCLIPQQEWVKLQTALTECGFIQANDQSELLLQDIVFTSRDPVLKGRPQTLTLQFSQESNLINLLQEPAKQQATKRSAALQSLRAKMWGHPPASDTPIVSIKVVTLPPEELFLYLCAQFYQHKDTRLFRLVSLLELVRKTPNNWNWERLAVLGQTHKLNRAWHEGVAAIQQLLGEKFMPPLALDLPFGMDAYPRVLEWARYGPDTLTRYTDLKQTYYYLLGLLSTPGIGAKSRYLFQSLKSKNGQRPILPGLLAELSGSVFTAWQKETHTHTAREFAYWIESSAA